MVRRVAYGALTLVVVLAIFSSDAAVAKEAVGLTGPLADLLRQGSTIPVVMVVLFILGAVEMNRLLRLKGARPHTSFAYLMTAVLILTPWLSAAGWLGHGAVEVEGIYWQAVWLMVATIGAGILTVMRSEPNGALRDMNATLAMIVFLGFLGSFGVQLRCARDTPAEDGAWLLLIVVLVTKASDIGGYLAGSVLGRHKLLPPISPAKSVEGAVGGMLCSAAVAMAFAVVCSGALALTSRGYAVDLVGVGSSAYVLLDEMTRAFSLVHAEGGLHPALRAFIFGIVLSAAGQFGDLIESCFKRDAGVKDSGNVIPRFGGILDLIDSLVPAMPVAWFLLTAVWDVV
ncbi:MAG: phosphatidate cytidylyltransferase [Planctomycetota bacterium]